MKNNHFRITQPILCFLFFCAGSLLIAQTPYAPEALDAKDYEKAEQGLYQYTNDLVYNSSVRANWINEHAFWYRNQFAEGNEFILVDITGKSKKRAFDHVKLAGALAEITSGKYEAFRLPFSQVDFSSDLKTMSFQIGSQRRFSYEPESGTLLAAEPKPVPPRNSILSPDGKKAATSRIIISL